MLCLRISAPFATFRNFSAGSFRPSAPFMTYSATYGLLLNLAGREMRAADDGKSTMTSIASGLPVFDLALGMIGSRPSQHVIYQQLHNYPVGISGIERKSATYGNKYNNTPARRVVLHDLNAVVAMRGDKGLEGEVLAGLSGRRPRYGLPFLGENNFLPNRIEPAQAETEARWLAPLEEGTVMDDLAEEPMLLTVRIDRVDMSQSRSGLFTTAARAVRIDAIPADAWVDVGYP